MGTLRLILAISVVLGHIADGNIFGLYMTVSGQLPVQSFYVISGFVIAFVFTEKYATRPDGLQLFWVNRFLRLWPAFVVVGLATAIAYPLSAAIGHPVVRARTD